MNQSIKQRIVGVLVIVVAGYVLLPLLFDGQGSYQMPLESRIPEPVSFPAMPVVNPARPVIIADTDQIRIDPPVSDIVPDAVPEPQITTNDTPEAPGLDSFGLPEGWSVRLASFSSYANALNLVDRLQSRGHPAYIRELPSAQGVLTAVFVGPGVDRAAVQQLQKQLQDEFELSGIVVRYEIEGL